jgi:hypothetical protein
MLALGDDANGKNLWDARHTPPFESPLKNHPPSDFCMLCWNGAACNEKTTEKRITQSSSGGRAAIAVKRETQWGVDGEGVGFEFSLSKWGWTGGQRKLWHSHAPAYLPLAT